MRMSVHMVAHCSVANAKKLSVEDVQGWRLKAPQFLSDALDSGAARRAAPNRNFMGGHNWGGGQRLGG